MLRCALDPPRCWVEVHCLLFQVLGHARRGCSALVFAVRRDRAAAFMPADTRILDASGCDWFFRVPRPLPTRGNEITEEAFGAAAAQFCGWSYNSTTDANACSASASAPKFAPVLP
jgi:hypothetical protein